ncbi:MAG TPA: beta-propeller fold lactonase family protein [Sedimentisphaerales bacterium]|nr:beta-propeller fold lactonase family protein [Sedimentisphaerales bacterium]
MKKLKVRKIWLAGSICVLAILAANAEVGSGDYLSPLAVVADAEADTIYIAEFTARQIAVFDTVGGRVTKSISLPARPSGVAIAPDKSRLYVTGAAPAGSVYVIDPTKGKVTSRISTGHTPTAPVVSPDGNVLYVCNRFDNDVAVINLKTARVVCRVSVQREPAAAAISPDGRLLFVANLLPAGAADQDYAAAAVTVIDTASKKVIATIQLPNGSTSLRGVCVSTDGQYAYITHVLSRYQLPTTQLERGWMNTNALSVIDVTGKKLVNTVLLDDVDLGAANPWGVACTDDGRYICVTHSGTHELSVIDRQAMHEKLEKVASGQKVSDVSLAAEDVPNDLSFLVGIRRRLKLAGNGPRGLVIIGAKAYIAEYFSDSLGVIDIGGEVRPSTRSVELGPKTPMTPERRGEMLFNNAKLCFQHWQSCVSCHPGARTDALNWDLLNDGIGNPKNTKSLLLTHKTPPAMITGIRDSAETAVRAGIRHILFTVRPEEDAVAIDQYLKSLEPVPSPYLTRGWFSKKPRLSKAARRGEKVFEKAGCSSCHSGPLDTDLQKYNVGTGKGREQTQAFDTPTLVEVWRTAPYLHDGRAATVKDMLVEHNIDDKHGRTSGLTEKQIADLAEFVLSR